MTTVAITALQANNKLDQAAKVLLQATLTNGTTANNRSKTKLPRIRIKGKQCRRLHQRRLIYEQHYYSS